jgi:hypothetical protein
MVVLFFVITAMAMFSHITTVRIHIMQPGDFGVC